MYTFRVEYSINLFENIVKMPHRYIEIDEYIDDNEILEEVISDKLIEALWGYYNETEITITNIELMECGYTNKELNNYTEDNKLC